MMDCGEVYIKKCERATEIQALRPGVLGQEGDWWAYTDILRGHVVEVLNHEERLYYRYPSCVWLPRQDQLQEMVTSDWAKWVSFLFAFAKNFSSSHIASMEQLAISFVMREKHGKVWGLEKQDWIKES